MKTKLYLATLLFLCHFVKAQDTLVFKNIKKIAAREISFIGADVKYKLFNEANSPDYYINKAELLYIHYQNGTKEIITNKTGALPKDTLLKKNFIYVNLLSLLFNSEPNLSYERRFKGKFGISLYGGYKFTNVLGRSLGASGIGIMNDAVRFCYQGPRAVLSFKYYMHDQRYFAGISIGASDFSIKNKSFYGNSSSDAQKITGLNSTRRDLDAGLTFGINNLFNRFQVYATLGLRNIWVTTTCTNIPGSPSVGGELAPFTAPVVNGYMGYMLYQAGINYIFPF